MPDYSEFPTTPTAWQEQALRDLTAPDPPALPAPEPAAPPRRSPDLTALVPGLVFVVIAVLGLTGAVLPGGLFRDGVLWLVLIGAGVALLLSEIRRPRRRH